MREIFLSLLMLVVTMLFGIGSAGCEDPAPPPVPKPLTVAEQIQKTKDAEAIEAATSCRDEWFNLATISVASNVRCPRADQRLSFEQDVDKDAYAVCRCIQRVPVKPVVNTPVTLRIGQGDFATDAECDCKLKVKP